MIVVVFYSTRKEVVSLKCVNNVDYHSRDYFSTVAVASSSSEELTADQNPPVWKVSFAVSEKNSEHNILSARKENI